MFRIPPRLVGQRERLDDPDADPAALEASLGDLRTINRLLGYSPGVVADVWPLVREAARLAPARPVTLLDAGAGSGDVAVALARRAARAGQPVRIVALDNHPVVLGVARRHLARVPASLAASIRLVRGDGLALPFGEGGVDVALASLFLHHLDGDLAVRLLRDLARVARVGVVVTDLVRHPLALLGIRALTRLGPFHPMTRHDGALSVRRAYTEAELLDLAGRAGLVEGGRLVRHPLWRMAFVWTRPGAAAGHRPAARFDPDEDVPRRARGGSRG